MSRCALVLGSAGQDGRILSAQLLAQGMRVVGVDVPNAVSAPGVELPLIALSDTAAVGQLVAATQPCEIYYLAAYHHAASEREQVDVVELLRRSFEVNVAGLIGILEGVRQHAPRARLFYASSSHVFGVATASPQDEATPRAPQSAYAISKCAGMDICRLMREQHGTYAVSGVLYNHESSLRGSAFVSSTIVRAAVAAARATERGETAAVLELGSLSSVVDWSAAEDVTRAMQAMLRSNEPQDCVVGSGIAHTVADFCELAFAEVGLHWEKFVRERPGAVLSTRSPLVANTARLRASTGWQPNVPFATLVRGLVREHMS